MAEISVIITTYNRKPSMLKRAIDSVLSQSYKDFELIIVDDSPESFEYRKDVAKSIEEIGDSRIRYIQHEKNMGACAARNTGLKNANGKYIGFLDDDDEYMPEKLELQKEILDKNPNIGMVTCLGTLVNDATGHGFIWNHHACGGRIFDKMMEANFIGTSYPLARRECYEKCGGFNEELLSSQDYEMFLRIAECYEVGFVKESLINSHSHGEGRITSNPGKKIQGTEKIIELYKEYLEKNKRIYSLKLFDLVKQYIRLKDYKQVLGILGKALRMYPLHLPYFCARTAFWMIKFRKG